MLNITCSGKEALLSENSNPRNDALARTAAPEKKVVGDPPPEPDYPRYRVEPGKHASLADVDPDETEHYRKKKDVRKQLGVQRRRIADLQARLYAENEWGLLIVLQAMNTGGKDGTIKDVFGGVNPQGCRGSS
jgi:polyphosphate kinase 2 (PPK2 family)